MDRVDTMEAIWSAAARRERMHRIWLAALTAQTQANPRHPANRDDQIERYQTVAAKMGQYPALFDKIADHLSRGLRHEVAVELTLLNDEVDGLAHLGMTSSDVTDVANQLAIVDSYKLLLDHVIHLAGRLAVQSELHRDRKMVARTHGRPAQLSTWGHRQATVLGPLLDWIARAQDLLACYELRPQHGAVGTAADQLRVLTGWSAAPGTDEKISETGLEATGSASEPPAGISAPPDPVDPVWVASTVGVGWHEWVVQRLASEHRHGIKGRLPWDVDGAEFGPATIAAKYRAIGRCSAQGHHKPHGYVAADGLNHTWCPGYELDPLLPHPDPEQEPELDSADPSTPMVAYNAAITYELAAGQAWLGQTRQNYHRSYDLPLISSLAELAAIAQTWATDRRLEVMLGLGAESHGDEQVGSSAMAHKTNPRICERICALAVLTRSHLGAFAEMAGMEWLEGDVSTSAARRLLLPQAFTNIDTLVANWCWLVDHWQPDFAAMLAETTRHRFEISSGVYLQALVEAGLSRTEAYKKLQDAYRVLRDERGESYPARFFQALAEASGGRLSTADFVTITDRLRDPDGPVGNVAEQIKWLARQVGELLSQYQPQPWTPAVKW
jgi:adenylosuccinate lyase